MSIPDPLTTLLLGTIVGLVVACYFLFVRDTRPKLKVTIRQGKRGKYRWSAYDDTGNHVFGSTIHGFQTLDQCRTSVEKYVNVIEEHRDLTDEAADVDE